MKTYKNISRIAAGRNADTALNGIKVIGSIVGTRKDLQETLQFAAEGKVKNIIELHPLEKINEVFD
jgi:alcohol dehydrogenase, propanol-preferring